MKYRWQTHNKAIPIPLDRLDTHQKSKDEKQKREEEYKNKEKHKQVTFLLLVEIIEERRRLHQYHSQHKSLCYLHESQSNYAYKEIKVT